MLRQLPQVRHPDLLIGTETGDDAAVYRLGDSYALVQTVDFFPPIVDDPYHFGAIAVANAVSDVYAKGGRPLLALNIVAFPMELPKEILGQVLNGGFAKAKEAGLLIVGGHTIDDQEPKYGLAVTGLVRPGAQVSNATARPGDVLVLTKPIGTGIITTAAKNDQTTTEVLAEAVESMEQLNRDASEAMCQVGVNACTDVTGFGLLGHLKAMMTASHTAARVSWAKVPLLPGAWDLAREGVAPGGTQRNLASLGSLVTWDKSLRQAVKLVLSDAQTSGGLLICVPPGKVDRLLKGLARRGVATRAVIGEVVEGEAGAIQVLP